MARHSTELTYGTDGQLRTYIPFEQESQAWVHARVEAPRNEFDKRRYESTHPVGIRQFVLHGSIAVRQSSLPYSIKRHKI